jgi:hypothetical protein
MKKWEILKNYKAKKFRRITGVKQKTFEKIIEILLPKRQELTAKGGPKPALFIEDMILAAIEYWREYRTYAHTAANFGISESTIFRIVRWVEDVLIKDGSFSLPGKKELWKEESQYEIILIDAAETPIERPKTNQKHYYSGKKKRHTLKTQIVTDKKTHTVICLFFANGKRHDFRVYKESNLDFNKDKKVVTDSGYTGIPGIHANSVLPRKKPKKKKLSKEDKEYNKTVSKERAANEHAIGFIKRFKILSERYRSRRKRFGLRFSLIAGICNFDRN